MKAEGQNASEKLHKEALDYFVVRREKLSQRGVDKAFSLARLGEERERDGEKEERIGPPLMLPVVDMKRRGL